MTQLVNSENNIFHFDTCMSEVAFTKIKMNIRETGLAAECDTPDKAKSEWRFSSWNFDETESKDGRVFLAGTFTSCKTLREIFESGDKELSKKAVLCVCSCMECAIATGMKIPHCGGEGILISQDFKRILFLSENIFKTCAQTSGKEDYHRFHDVYVNPRLNGNEYCRFFEANLIYRVVVNNFPYNDIDSRGMDLFDRHYTPMEYSMPCVEVPVVKFTDGILSGKDYNLDFPYDALKLQFAKTEPTMQQIAEYVMNVNRAVEHKKNHINRLRWIRKNSVAIIVVLGSVLGLSWFIHSYYTNLMKKPGSKGLDARQTVEMFYSAMNLLDTDAASGSATKKMNYKINSISTLFVSTRSRSIYESKYQSFYPAKWFNVGQWSFNIYGLSDFTIDNVQGSLVNKGNPRGIKNISPAQNGETKLYTVHYYIVDTPGDTMLAVDEVTEKVTVVYVKDRWRVDSVEPVQNEIIYTKADFVADVESMTMEELRQKYDFIPTDAELKESDQYERSIN